jgi:replicative DNA helicase
MKTVQMLDEYQNQLPNATDIEEIIIGGLLVDTSGTEQVMQLLWPEMFHDSRARLLFGTITQMLQNKESVSLPTVTLKIRDLNKMEDIGGIGYLQLCAGQYSFSYQVNDLARIVAEKYIHREIIAAAKQILQKGNSVSDPDELLKIFESVQSMVTDIISGGETGMSSFDAVKLTLNELELQAVEYKSGILPGIATGFKTLDECIGGFRKSTFTILAGRPGEGKTSLGLHFAKKAAETGKRVLIFSYEMTNTELIKILLSAKSFIKRTKIRDADLEETDWEPIKRAAGEIANYPVRWFDNPYITIDQLISLVKKYNRLTGVDFVVVDYLQLVSSTVKTQYREQEVATITRSLKALANSEKISVMALAQLNRQDFGDNGPELKHLRESGSIEQDADCVLFTWKPSFHGFDVNDSTIELKIAKNRNGILARFPNLIFKPLKIYQNE